MTVKELMSELNAIISQNPQLSHAEVWYPVEDEYAETSAVRLEHVAVDVWKDDMLVPGKKPIVMIS